MLEMRIRNLGAYDFRDSEMLFFNLQIERNTYKTYPIGNTDTTQKVLKLKKECITIIVKTVKIVDAVRGIIFI